MTKGRVVFPSGLVAGGEKFIIQQPWILMEAPLSPFVIPSEAEGSAVSLSFSRILWEENCEIIKNAS